MENLEKIEKHINTANSIKNGINRYYEVIKSPSCDKHNIGFNIDSRFSTMEITISIDSYTGSYGSSSCSTFLNIYDKSIFKEHFLKYLNLHFKEIMFAVSQSIENDALKFKEKAQNELEERLENIKSLGKLLDEKF